jgi:hypothetical protein
MPGEQLNRTAVLAYRAAAHDLDGGAADPAGIGVLEAGVQDTPPGSTAGPALRARLASPADAERAMADDLALVHSMRGTMHVHRPADLPMLVAALRPDDAADLLPALFGTSLAELAADGESIGPALDRVAAAMAEAMSDGRTRSKGELSTEINARLPVRLRPWCAGCGVHHVHDGLFRMASLPAGLRLRPTGRGSAAFVAAALGPPVDPAHARRELTRRFLRRCGPASVHTLAAWLGSVPAAARRWWRPMADELAEVSVEGRRLWMHAEDLPRARQAARPRATVLLPPYDPLLELADRQLLLPDPGTRRQVWRSVANPGVVLISGEVAGTWRRRRNAMTVAPFQELRPTARRTVRLAAERYAAPADVEVTFAT